MPNWTENTIEITFDNPTLTPSVMLKRAQDIIENVTTESELDFEKIIPMPADVYRESLGYEEMKKYPNNWYDWSRRNWGTKWNACNSYWDGSNVITFSTAWCPVPQILRALSIKYPEATFLYKYTNEDDGYEMMYEEAWSDGDCLYETSYTNPNYEPYDEEDYE